MKTAALVLCVLLPQDQGKIEEWLRQLEEDSVELREKAFGELVKAGRAAEKRLREAQKGTTPELRAQATQILAEIEKRERARRFDAGPSLVTLKAERTGLKEVLESIRKQTRMPMTFTDIPAEDKVSVSLDRKPLFEALDSVCRAHGGIDFDIEEDWDEAENALVERALSGAAAAVHRVSIHRRKYGTHPRTTGDQFVLWLRHISYWIQNYVGGEEKSGTSLHFEWGWETGTRPVGAQLRITDVRDDLGNSYGDDFRNKETELERFRLDLDGGVRSREVDASIDRVPRTDAKRFSLLRGTLEIKLPERSEDFSFDDPAGKIREERKAESGSVQLLSFSREGNAVKAGLQVRPEGLSDRLRVRVVDKEGREYHFHHRRGRGDGSKIDLTMDFEVPAKVEVATLRCTAQTGAVTKKLPFEFRDVRIRQ